MLEAKGIIEPVVACRMVSGDSISILNDPRLHNVQSPFIVTRNEALEGKSVYYLLVTGENRWDIDLLYDMFEVRDVYEILSIPLNNGEQDVW